MPRGLKPGDAVRIVSLDTNGYVLAEPDADGNVLVQAGIIKMTVPLTTWSGRRRSSRPRRPARPPAAAPAGRAWR